MFVCIFVFQGVKCKIKYKSSQEKTTSTVKQLSFHTTAAAAAAVATATTAATATATTATTTATTTAKPTAAKTTTATILS